MLFFMQQQVLITYKRNYFKNISDNPCQMGFILSKPSISGLLGVCVSLTATNGRQMCSRYPERYHHKISGLEATLFPGKWGIHTRCSSACSDITKAGTVARPRGKILRGVGRSGKKSPDLAEPLRAADIDCNNVLFRFSIIWPPFLQCLINADTLWILL